jgi:uncharacterized protein
MTDMTDDEIKHILKTAHIVASVGLSSDQTKDSFGVAVYLQRASYHLIPINPKADKILGATVYRDLPSIPMETAIHVVQIFRPADEVPALVAQAIQIGAKAVWMQEGIVNEAAAQAARMAGLQVVMDRCMMKEHRRLLARSNMD